MTKSRKIYTPILRPCPLKIVLRLLDKRPLTAPPSHPHTRSPWSSRSDLRASGADTRRSTTSWSHTRGMSTAPMMRLCNAPPSNHRAVQTERDHADESACATMREPVANIPALSTARNSKPLEVLGTYEPQPKKNTADTASRRFKDIKLDMDRARYWLGVGAQPSEPMWRMLSMVSSWPAAMSTCAPDIVTSGWLTRHGCRLALLRASTTRGERALWLLPRTGELMSGCRRRRGSLRRRHDEEAGSRCIVRYGDDGVKQAYQNGSASWNQRYHNVREEWSYHNASRSLRRQSSMRRDGEERITY